MYRYICIDFGYLSVIISSAGPVFLLFLFLFLFLRPGPQLPNPNMQNQPLQPQSPALPLSSPSSASQPPVTASRSSSSGRSGSPGAPDLHRRPSHAATPGLVLNFGRPAAGQVRLMLTPTGPVETLHSSELSIITLLHRGKKQHNVTWSYAEKFFFPSIYFLLYILSINIYKDYNSWDYLIAIVCSHCVQMTLERCLDHFMKRPVKTHKESVVGLVTSRYCVTSD